MKATSLSVGKTYNTGNYTSVRLDMTVDLEPNDNLIKAKLDCELLLDSLMTVSTKEYKFALQVLASPDEYTGNQVKRSLEIVQSVDGPKVPTNE